MDTLIRFDWYMKRMLRDKANYVILEGLLTVLLGRPIKIKSILESEGNQENEADKFNRVDLLAEDTDGELMIFEIQNSRELDYFHRMLFGTAKAVTEYIKIGDEYGEIRKVYSINIVYFDIGQGKDYVYHGSTEFVGLHDPNDVLELSQRQKERFRCQPPAGIIPEYYLIKVNNFGNAVTTPLDEWIGFLKTGKIATGTSVPGLAEVRERMRIDNLSDEEQRAYNRHWENVRYQSSMMYSSHDDGYVEGHADGHAEGWKEGRAEGEAMGIEKGRAEGIEKGRAEGEAIGVGKGILQVARSMKQMGMSAGQIAKATGLTLEDIEGL